MAGEPPLQTTQALLSAARQGDEQAFRLLYDRYMRRLKSAAHGRIPLRARGLHDTQSVAHEVLANCLRREEEAHGSLGACFRAYCSKALRNRLSRLWEATAKRQLSDLDEELPDGAPCQLERMMEDEFHAQLSVALGRLSARHQQVIQLRFFERLPHEEVAQRMGLNSPDAARVLVGRALARTRDYFLQSTESAA